MIKRVIKQFTPNWKCLDEPKEQAKAIQDLYDQMREILNYFNSSEFDIKTKGEKGDKGDTGEIGPQGIEGPVGPQGVQGIPGNDGENGKSSYELWKLIPGNEHKTIEDYFNEIVTDPKSIHGSYKVINITEDITVEEVTDEETQLIVLYVNNTSDELSVTVINSEIYKTPTGENLDIYIPAGGYGEVNFLNIGGIYFIKGD